ncbi:hypothetical protein [uncultured Paracoccus sp.]|uniref:hypothetical protein n=1 Tax=uncultured Paracoccus sp. TaxID=189685 RepID=UPI00262811FC|nr:hypothetical protein [uncultured Paracoccus sp.]
MSDIKASERRLAAALDRMDYLLETAAPRQAGQGGADPALQARLDQALADNDRLQAALEAMRQPPQSPSDLDGQDDGRLIDLADHAARLSQANEELVAANRGLIEAMAGDTDGVEAVAVALEAEIEALRAARAAEIAQIAEIMAELQRMLSDSAASDAPFAADVAGPAAAARAAEIVSFGDEGGVPELTRERDPGFDAVYGEDGDELAEDDDLDDAESRGR